MPRAFAIHDAMCCGVIYNITTWKPPPCSVTEDQLRKCEHSYTMRHGGCFWKGGLGLLPKLYCAEEPPGDAGEMHVLGIGAETLQF